MKKILIVLTVFVFMTGCATQRFIVNDGGNTIPDKETVQAFFVHGIGQEQEMNAAQLCGGADKVAKVETHVTFIDGLLGAITWGIYTPRTAKVYCVN